MKLFQMKWAFGNNPIIEGLHKWTLPGVECPVCGHTWGDIGCEYPAVDLSILKDVKTYLKAWPVPLEKLEELRKPLRSLVGPDLPLPPGTQFGTIGGRALAKVGDFAWARTMTPLISNKALEKLSAVGIENIKCLPAEVRLRNQSDIKLFVLHVEPLAR